jgi:DNA invertase Pin-like site-specific DNA recombinase
MYLRRSTDRQEQSIGDQRTALMKYAAAEGFRVVGEYVDDAISGADTESRKAFLRMIDEARAPGRPWDYVLVYDVSRFGRVETDEAGYYRHLLTCAGVEIVYAAEGFRGDESDDLIRSTKQWVANQQVKSLSRVTIRGQVSLANKGRWCGGRPPYGYDLVYHDWQGVPYQRIRFLASGDRHIMTADASQVLRTLPRGTRQPPADQDFAQLVPGDPDRVAIVQRIFSMYVDDLIGLGAIAGKLNAERIPSPGRGRTEDRAGKWSLSTIREIVRNPAYRGAIAWNRRTYAKFHRVEKGEAVARPKTSKSKTNCNAEEDWIVIEDQHEALIPRTLWDRAQIEQKMRAGTVTPEQMRAGRQTSKYILSGLMRCRSCGANWQGYKTIKGKRKPGQKRIETLYYCCGGYIRRGNAGCPRALVGKDDLEDAVMNVAQEYLTQFVESNGAKMLAGLISDEASTTVSDEHALRTRIDGDRKRLDELIACLTPSLASTLESRIIALRNQIESGEARLKDLSTMRVSQAEARRLVEGVVTTAATLGDVMRAGSPMERKAIVRGLVKEIAIDPKTGEGEAVFYGIPLAALPQNEMGRKAKMLISPCEAIAGERLHAIENYSQYEALSFHVKIRHRDRLVA